MADIDRYLSTMDTEPVGLNTNMLRQTMTHMAPQLNPAQPYLDAAKQFAHGGISEVLQNRGAQPAWMKAGDFLHSEAANMALGVMGGIPKTAAIPAGTERIVSAAYKIGDRVFQSPIHAMAKQEAMQALGLTKESELIDRQPGSSWSERHANHEKNSDGFVTSTGRFVDRKEADEIARNQNQLKSEAKRRLGGINAEDINMKSSPIGKASEIAAQLKGALGTEHFQPILSELQDADKGHVLDVAKEFMGRSFSSKSEAIRKMQERHNALLQFESKRRFMAGRSAG